MVAKKDLAIIWINGMFHLTGGTVWDIYFSNAEGTEVKHMKDRVFSNCVASFDLVLA